MTKEAAKFCEYLEKKPFQFCSKEIPKLSIYPPIPPNPPRGLFYFFQSDGARRERNLQPKNLAHRTQIPINKNCHHSMVVGSVQIKNGLQTARHASGKFELIKMSSGKFR